MSNGLAIAATTATIRNLLLTQLPLIDTELADLEVTTQPPDLARKGIVKTQLNLFLYQASVNAAWRNRDLPNQVRPGETGIPPLALDLHYLLTAYGRGEIDNDGISQRALGCAMGLLNDHALLGSDEIAAALTGNDLGEQIERVRITANPMGTEEMSKLWTTFQSQYRISTAYQVGVILIDSRRAVRSPLPVLRRGAADRGPVAVAGSAPVLELIRMPRSQSAVRLGESFVVVGKNLSLTATSITISRLGDAPSSTSDDITIVPIAADAAGEIRVQIANAGASPGDDPQALYRWHPGYYLLALRQTKPGLPAISSNALPFALAPRITLTPLAALAGTLVLTLTCAPRLRDGQRVHLILGDRQFAPDSVATPPGDLTLPSTLTFTVPSVEVGSRVVRLRVDGVDSIPATFVGNPAIAEFDPAQTLVVT
jgi:Pvc16 N-terminal domain